MDGEVRLRKSRLEQNGCAENERLTERKREREREGGGRRRARAEVHLAGQSV